MCLVLAVAMFILAVLLLLLYTCIREAKESKSAKVELTKMEDLKMHVNPPHTFNTYTGEERMI